MKQRPCLQPGWGKVEDDGACPHHPWAEQLDGGRGICDRPEGDPRPSQNADYLYTVLRPDILDHPLLKSTKMKDKRRIKENTRIITEPIRQQESVQTKHTVEAGVLRVNEAEVRLSQEVNPGDLERWYDAMQVEMEGKWHTLSMLRPTRRPFHDAWSQRRALISVDGNKRDYTVWTRRLPFSAPRRKTISPEQS